MDLHGISEAYRLHEDLLIFFAGCFVVLLLLHQIHRLEQAIQYEEWLNSLPG